MRKKTKQSVDVAAVNDAWEALFSSSNIADRDQLRKEGWIDSFYAAERMGVNAQTATYRLKRMNVETKKFSVLWDDGRTRAMNFFRLK